MQKRQKMQSTKTLRPSASQFNQETVEMQTTAIVIPKDIWNLLREVAFRRAQSSGGRASVSEVLRSLIETHRTELEKEAKKK